MFTQKDYNPFPKTNYGPALFWIPLICYYSGARPIEIVQLLKKDLLEESGIHYIRITDGDEKSGQSLKTESSSRDIPLHRDLIDLGFLDYVQSIPEDSRLWRRSNDAQNNKQYLNAFSKKWAEYIRKKAMVNKDVNRFSSDS